LRRHIDGLKGSLEGFAASSDGQAIGPEDVFETLFALTVEHAGLEPHPSRLITMMLKGDTGNTQREKGVNAG
jgi:hypothetical protein